jgi:MFS family permease
VGPACGGLLASPATLYPRIFGSIPLFVNFPYLLPNLVTAFFGLVGFIMILLFFPETLHNKENNSSPAQCNDAASTNQAGQAVANSKVAVGQRGGAGVLELCRTPGVIYVLIVYFLISLNSIVFDEVVPLWSMASPDVGGLGLPQVLIGYMMTITGVILTIYTFTIYPLLSAWLGDQLGFKVSMAVFGPTVILITLLSAFQLTATVRFMLLVTMYALSKSMTSLGFACTGLMLNHCVSKDKRASLNGLAMTFGSLAKSTGPLSGALIFAWSLNSKYKFPLDFHFVFVILFIVSCVAVMMKLPETKKKPAQSGTSSATANKDGVELGYVNGREDLTSGESEGSDNGSDTVSGLSQTMLTLVSNAAGSTPILQEKRFGKYSTVSTLEEEEDDDGVSEKDDAV